MDFWVHVLAFNNCTFFNQVFEAKLLNRICDCLLFTLTSQEVKF